MKARDYFPAWPFARNHSPARGWWTQKFGGFLKSGDTLAVGACELRVEEMDGPRVARLKITRRTEAKA